MKRFVDNTLTALTIGFVVAAMLYLLLPVLMAVFMSLDARTFLGPFPPQEFSLQWFESFFSDDYYLNGLKTSLLLATLTAVISTAIGGSAAVALARARFERKELLTSLMLSPLIVPAVVIGFSLLLFLSYIGVYDGFVRLLAGHVLITVPYTIRTTLASLGGIKSSLHEAALSLGANERQAFWDVTFPLAKTGVFAGAVFAFAFSLDDVAVSLFLADPKAYTLPIALVSMMRSNFDLTIAAAAVMLIAVTALLIVVLDRMVGLDRLVRQDMYRG